MLHGTSHSTPDRSVTKPTHMPVFVVLSSCYDAHMSSVQLWRDRSNIFVQFAPEQLGVLARRIDSHTAEPMTPEQALEDPSVLLVAPGPMFGCCPGQSCSYQNYRCGRIQRLLFDRRRNVDFASLLPNQGSTLLVQQRGLRSVASMSHESRIDASTRVAVQGYPTVVAAGRNVASPSLNTDATARPALCLLSNGQLALVATVGSMTTLAEKCLAAGAQEAIYLDGGGSGYLAWRGDGWFPSREHRRLPAFVVINQPSSMSTGSKVAAIGVAAALAAGATYALTRKKNGR